MRQEKSSKQILREVSGLARPGEVLAIMGASGAGKSTLLNTLLFRNSGGLDISGTRIADGEVAGRIFSNKIRTYSMITFHSQIIKLLSMI